MQVEEALPVSQFVAEALGDPVPVQVGDPVQRLQGGKVLLEPFPLLLPPLNCRHEAVQRPAAGDRGRQVTEFGLERVQLLA